VWRWFVSGLLGAAVSLGGCGRSEPVAIATFEPPPLMQVPGGNLALEFCAPNVVRVAFAPAPAFFARPSLATAARRCEPTAWRSTRGPGQVTYTTSRLSVRVDTTGRVTFLDLDGQPILTERPNGGRTLTPATIQGEATFNVRQEWEPNADESLYGLGQHQQGLFDIKDYDLDLRQYNTEIYIPFLMSSRGYGILWDNTSFTRFGDLSGAVPLPGAADLYKAGGEPGEVDPRSGTVTWSGTVVPEVSGDALFRAYYSGNLRLVVDGQTVIDHFRQNWLPNEDFARVRLSAGKPVEVRLEWQRHSSDVNIVRLLWKPPISDRTTSLWSRVGDGVDYTFVYGPELDDVIAGYRRLTGEAPMMPRWAYGFWMSRERYKAAQETLDVLAGYRSRHLPIDNIVQDWQYWKEAEWGSHAFDPERFPDVDAWVKTVHDTYHAQLMLSVWAKFHTGTQNFDALNGAGYLYQLNLAEQRKDHIGYTFTYYDAFNPAARQLYWSQIEQALVPRGFDAWWVDASEPEIVQDRFPSVAAHVATSETHMHPTALGTGSRMLNAYSLVQSQAIFEGLSAAQPDKRPFILTRNGFAGQQRYAAASWSSDVSSTWTSLQRQVPAGLSFCLSGIPYWTLDIGGFAVPARFSQNPSEEALAEWYELNTRWFELGTFLPLMRVHGQPPAREIWEFGGDGSPAYQAMAKFQRLRYRLLPYIYSAAGGVTRRGGTLLRALVMDFRSDPVARTIGDAFMFGPALLVAPVMSYGARERSVYLPTSAGGWYDFWTGRHATGGQTALVAAPFDSIPLQVRAGAIIPVGPELEYAAEKPADPITLMVYAGADGHFVLYEDQGLDNGCRSGQFSEIPIDWHEGTRTLVIGAREGSFSGMLAERSFEVVLISEQHPVGFSFTPTPERSVVYTGAALELHL